jgi:hypothetical protein
LKIYIAIDMLKIDYKLQMSTQDYVNEDSMPTINGTSSNDIMNYSGYQNAPPVGWPVDQAWLILNGLTGNDVIYGSSYNDYIDGGSGQDLIYGNGGNDLIYGGGDVDTIYGGSGNDTVFAGAGGDYLYGEDGNDKLYGGAYSDELYGGNGNDTLVGDGATDKLYGGGGDDILLGGASTDQLIGGAGNDILWGGSGNDNYIFDGLGIDHINDGVTDSGSARVDTAYDIYDKVNVSFSAAEIAYERRGNDLWITNEIDIGNPSPANALVIDSFYLGGHYTVETLITSDGYNVNLLGLLA